MHLSPMSQPETNGVPTGEGGPAGNGRPCFVLMGQTPPPWHGQAVATKMLFDHDWPDFEVHRVRMGYSEEMTEVSRFRWKKIGHLAGLIVKVRRLLKEHPGSTLLYPPASAKWIPFLRDVAFLWLVRPLAKRTVFIFHASGLAGFAKGSVLRRWLAWAAYGRADLSFEVLVEDPSPHDVFRAKRWQWCPCATDVPPLDERDGAVDRSLNALFVGSMQEGKGVLEVMKTAAELKRRGRADGYRFRLVGKWFSEEFRQIAEDLHKELELDDLVEFVGERTGDAKWKEYQNADVFFFPTHYASEGSPIVVMEALGAGLPVISTEWRGIPKMLDGCPAARILPVRSPEAYADVLEELAGNPEWLKASGPIAHEFYGKYFLPEHFCGRIERGLHLVVGPEMPTSKFDETKSQGDPEGGLAVCESTAPRDTVLDRVLDVVVYLADQHPAQDRSIGISNMTSTLLQGLGKMRQLRPILIASRSSLGARAIDDLHRVVLPIPTKYRFLRLASDSLHRLIAPWIDADLWFYPKGHLPFFVSKRSKVIATVHDSILQHYADHYPQDRSKVEYAYWIGVQKRTLSKATMILTISDHARDQILRFCERYGLTVPEIRVIYEASNFETWVDEPPPEKGDAVVHLASTLPHKRTIHLLEWWRDFERSESPVPPLRLIGRLNKKARSLAESCQSVTILPFLPTEEYVSQIRRARALILPSEIEGFGLPALEAYYLGTPVCYVKETSVEEVLGRSTERGGFELSDAGSLRRAMDDVMAMNAGEIHSIARDLHRRFSSRMFASAVAKAFDDVAR